MQAKIAIYLAGSIKKGKETTNESFWTEADRLLIEQNLAEYQVSFLNPAFRTDNLSDQRSVFGRDMTQVFCSDFVFVDGRDKRGLGVGAEMMWAKVHSIPIVTLAPKNTHYHKSKTDVLGVGVENWVHPFVESLSDAVVENLMEGAAWMRRYLSGSASEVKGIETIRSAMRYYRETQLPHDGPMKALLETNQKLQQRAADLKRR